MRTKIGILIALVMAVTLCLVTAAPVAAVTTLPYSQSWGSPNTVDVAVEDTGDGWLQWTYTYPVSPTHLPKMTVAIDYPNGFCITTFDDGSHDGWYYAIDGGAEVWLGNYAGYDGTTVGFEWVETSAVGNVLTVRIQKSALGLSFMWHGYANVNGQEVWIEIDGNWVPTGDITIDPDQDVGLTAAYGQIIAINVYPTSIDFGDVTPGTPSSLVDINVKNIGTVTVDVEARLASLTSVASVFKYLKLDGSYPSVQGYWLDIFPSSLMPSITKSKAAVLDVPVTYSARGPEQATIAFIATPAP